MTDSTAAPQEHVETAPAVNQPDQQEARFAPLQILKGVVVQPRTTFARLRSAERGHWWLVLLLHVVAICLLAYATTNAQTSRFQGFMAPTGAVTRSGGFTPQQTASATRRTASTPQAGATTGQTETASMDTGQWATMLSTVAPIVFNVGGVVLGYLSGAFVVFAMSIVLGGKTTYAQVFRMAAWASLPLAVRTFVQAVISFVTGNVPAPGLSAVMTTQEAQDIPILYTLLGYVDIYLIWSMVLLGVGTAITARLNKRKSAAIVVVYLALAAGAIVGLMLAGDALADLFGGQFNLGMLTGGARRR